MNMTLLGAYILFVLMILLTPGPVVALITGTAARYGYRKAFATVVGTNGASLVLIALATLMLAGVVSLSPIWLYLVGILGSIYIGYGAIQTLRALLRKEAPASAAAPDNGAGFVRGFLTGIAKPKDILFFVSFFPQFIAITQNFSTSVITLSLVWVLFDFLVLTLCILTVKRWIPARHGVRIELVSSLFLLTVSLCGIVYNVHKVINIMS